jgi:hypothetical protein
MQYENVFTSHSVTNCSLAIGGTSNGDLPFRNTGEFCYANLPSRPAENSDGFHFELRLKKIK